MNVSDGKNSANICLFCILIAVFVVLFAQSSPSSRRIAEASASLQQLSAHPIETEFRPLIVNLAAQLDPSTGENPGENTVLDQTKPTVDLETDVRPEPLSFIKIDEAKLFSESDSIARFHLVSLRRVIDKAIDHGRYTGKQPQILIVAPAFGYPALKQVSQHVLAMEDVIQYLAPSEITVRSGYSPFERTEWWIGSYHERGN